MSNSQELHNRLMERMRPLVEVARASGRFEWLVEQMALQEHAEVKSLISGMTLIIHMLMAAMGIAGLALGWVVAQPLLRLLL